MSAPIASQMIVEEIWHACTPYFPFRALCGDDQPNTCTTSMVDRINCVACHDAIAEMLNPPAPPEGK